MPDKTRARVPSRHPPLVLVIGARGIPDVEGGAEKNAEMLFPKLVQDGYRIILLGLSDHMHETSYRGVELYPLPTWRVLNTDKLGYYLKALRIAWKLRPEIVHLQGLGASLFLWAYKLMGARVVVRYGSADYEVSKWGLIGRLGFLAAEYQTRFADAVIAVAPALVRRLAAHGVSRNVYMIANAVDGAMPQSVRSAGDEASVAAPYMLSVGRITAQKNIHGLIAGYRQFRATSGLPHRLLLAGGLEDAAYVHWVRGLIAGDPDILLLGHCNRARLSQLYRDADLCINASMHEGSSNAVLEAVDRGCPTILSGIPENRDFAMGEHCYFDPRDGAAMGERMAEAIATPARFVADRAAFLTWDTVAARTSEVYRAILR